MEAAYSSETFIDFSTDYTTSHPSKQLFVVTGVTTSSPTYSNSKRLRE
jgi:hypothetical protein